MITVLNETAVAAMRRLVASGQPKAKVARLFGTSHRNLNSILAGDTWRDC